MVEDDAEEKEEEEKPLPIGKVLLPLPPPPLEDCPPSTGDEGGDAEEFGTGESSSPSLCLGKIKDTSRAPAEDSPPSASSSVVSPPAEDSAGMAACPPGRLVGGELVEDREVKEEAPRLEWSAAPALPLALPAPLLPPATRLRLRKGVEAEEGPKPLSPAALRLRRESDSSPARGVTGMASAPLPLGASPLPPPTCEDPSPRRGSPLPLSCARARL